MNDSHQRAAELHQLAAHAHSAAMEHHGKGDHQTGHEHSKMALEHSTKAFELTQAENRKNAPESRFYGFLPQPTCSEKGQESGELGLLPVLIFRRMARSFRSNSTI